MAPSNENTQLTQAIGYNPERIIFSDPIAGEIPDSKPKIEFKRVIITTKNEDGSVGELIIPTLPNRYSFGVSTNTSQETGNTTGYTLPICLYDQKGPSKEEEAWVDSFNNIVEHIIKYIANNNDSLDLVEVTERDLKKEKGGLNPLWWKKEKVKDESGKMTLKRVPDRGPTIYAKMLHSKKHNKFLTQFFNKQDEPINPEELMGKHCHTTAAIKIESIFIGAKISLQVKVCEAVVEPVNVGLKRLLATRPECNSKVLASMTAKTATLAMEDDDNDDAGSLNGDQEDKKSSPKKTAPVRNVKRIVKKAPSE